MQRCRIVFKSHSKHFLQRIISIFLLLSIITTLIPYNFTTIVLAAYENFTDGTWVEVDPNNHISPSSTYINVTGLTRAEDAMYYKDYGAGYFNDSFTHEIDARAVSGQDGGVVVFYQLANIVEDCYYIRKNLLPSIWLWFNPTASYDYLKLFAIDSSGVEYSDYASFSFEYGKWYYFTIVRSPSSVTVYIYNDSARTELLDTLTVTMDTTSFRYLYAVNSYNSATSYTIDADIANLDIGAVSGTPPTVTIQLDNLVDVYEGQIIPCTIENATTYYWYVDRDRDGIQDPDEPSHYTFVGDDILLYRPEATPLGSDYVDIVLVAQNGSYTATDNVTVKLYKLWFGDIHGHTTYSDGTTPFGTFYSNTASDGYLDFFGTTDHAKALTQAEWTSTQENTTSYYDAGNFTTILAYEWTAHSNDGQNRSHGNLFFKDVQDYAVIAYTTAGGEPDYIETTWQKLLQRFDILGYYGKVIFVPHHPIAQAVDGNDMCVNSTYLFSGNVDWTLLNKYMRGVEVTSIWGTAICNHLTQGISWNHPYASPSTDNYTTSMYVNKTDYWVENFLWKWRAAYLAGHITNFMPAFLGSGDTHRVDRAGCGSIQDLYPLRHPNPASLTAVWAVHNTRDEIWDALNNCTAYATQLYKIRGNYFVNGQMAIAKVIDLGDATYLNITITANATTSSEIPPKEDATDLVSACYPKIRQVWLFKNSTTEPRFIQVAHWWLNSTSDNNVVLYYNTTNFEDGDMFFVVIEQSSPESDIDQFLDPAYKDFEKWHTWRAFLSPVMIRTTTGGGTPPPSSGWAYYKELTISDPGGVSADYQMRLKVYAGAGTDDPANGTVYCDNHCVNFPADIRFCTSSPYSDSNVIPQWIETYSTTEATIWIKLPSDGSDTIYMFVGNSTATMYSDGDAVFILYDSMETDVSGWEQDPSWDSAGGSYSQSSERVHHGSYSLKHSETSGSFDGVHHSTTVITDDSKQIDIWFYIPSVEFNDPHRLYCTEVADNANVSHQSVFLKFDDGTVYYYDGVAYNAIGSYTADAWHHLRLYNFNFTASTFDIDLDDSNLATGCSFRNTGISNISYIQSFLANTYWYLDCVLIRKYADTEPSWSSFGSWTAISQRTWKTVQRGWVTFGNTSSWQTIQRGWVTFGNISAWKTVQRGWVTFRNILSWKTIQRGWVTFGNTSSWKTVQRGWVTFGNASSWNTIQRGWVTFGNTSSWKTIQRGWVTFGNTSSWRTIQRGWVTFGNISTENRTWQTIQRGWITFGNTSSWNTVERGWVTFGNTSSWKTVQRGWVTFSATDRVWRTVQRGWVTFGNYRNWKTVERGWTTFGNTSSWRTIQRGWVTFAAETIDWWNTSWIHYKVIYIDNKGYSDYYQIKLNVTYNGGGDASCDGHCNANFSDLRFLQTDNSTLLPYWIEKKVDGQYAIVWVNVSATSMAEGKILMYYGNPSATSLSDGNATFEFFDDFWGTSLNTTKWDDDGFGGKPGLSGYYTVHDGYLEYWSTANTFRILKANYNISDSRCVTWRIRTANATGNGNLWEITDDDLSERIAVKDKAGDGDFDFVFVIANTISAEDSIAWENYTYYKLSNIKYNNTYGKCSIEAPNSTIYESSVHSYDSWNTTMYPSIIAEGGNHWYIDWIFVRVYLDAAPTVASTSSEYTLQPSPPSSVTVTSKGNSWIALSWTKDPISTNTVIRYSTTSYPTSPEPSNYNSTGTSYNFTGLSPGTTYYFSLWGWNSAGYSSPTYFSTTTSPVTPQNLEATSVNTTTINLTWTKGAGAQTTVIVRKTTGYPTSISDGTVIYNNTGTFYTDTGLSPGTSYYYRAWSYANGEYSLSYDSAMNYTYPAPPTSITSSENGTSITLSWTKGEGSTHTIIRYSTSSYPTSLTDGTLAYNDTGTTTTISSSPNTTYYFSFWSYDADSNYYSQTYSTYTTTTSVTLPTVETQSAISITKTSAILRGHVNDLGGASSCEAWIEWGTTTSYGNETTHYTITTVPSVYTPSVSNLTSGTAYHFRAVATNDAGTSYGSDKVFITLPSEPTNFTAVKTGATYVNLSWTPFSSPNCQVRTVIRYSTTGFEDITQTSGTLAYNGTNNYTIVSGLVVGTTYYFKAYTLLNYSGIYQFSNDYATLIVTTTGGNYTITVRYENESNGANNPVNLSKYGPHTLIIHYYNETDSLEIYGNTVNSTCNYTADLKNGTIIVSLKMTPLFFEFKWNDTNSSIYKCRRIIIPEHGSLNVTFYIYTNKPIYGEATSEAQGNLATYTYSFIDPSSLFTPTHHAYVEIYTYNSTGVKQTIDSQYLTAEYKVYPMLIVGKKYFIGIHCDVRNIDRLGIAPTTDNLYPDPIEIPYAETINYTVPMIINLNVGWLSNGFYVFYQDTTFTTVIVTFKVYDANENLLYQESSTQSYKNFSYETSNTNETYYYEINFTNAYFTNETIKGIIYPGMRPITSFTSLEDLLETFLGNPAIYNPETGAYVSWVYVLIASIGLILLLTFSYFNAHVGLIASGLWLIFARTIISGLSIYLLPVGVFLIFIGIVTAMARGET